MCVAQAELVEGERYGSTRRPALLLFGSNPRQPQFICGLRQ